MKYFHLVLSFLLVACSSTSETVSQVETPQDLKKGTPREELYCADIIALSEIPDTLKMAGTTIVKYTQKQGCVCITYQYSGCREGETLLTYSSDFQKDPRPTVKMKLGVFDAGLCDQLLTDSACFSLKKLQLIGNQVLVYINQEQNNLLIDFEEILKD